MADKGERLFLRRYPSFGLLIFFVLGLLLSRILSVSTSLVASLLIIASIFGVVRFIARRGRNISEPDNILSAIALVVVLLAGFAVSEKGRACYDFPSGLYEVEGTIVSEVPLNGGGALIELDDVSIGGVREPHAFLCPSQSIEGWQPGAGIRIGFVGSAETVNKRLYLEMISSPRVIDSDIKLVHYPLIMREKLKKNIAEVTDEKSAGLIIAITLGIRDELSRDWYGAFTRSGNGHLLAVSGLHTGLICLLIYFFTGFITYRKKLRWLAAFLGCLLFMLLVGFHPPVVRATVMIFATFSANMLGRKGNPLNALFFAALVILVFDPRCLDSPSFLLSVFAILGILVLGLPLSERIRKPTIMDNTLEKVWIWFLKYTCISVSAWAFTTPLVAYFFGSVNPYSFLFALVTIPLLSVLVCCSVVLLVTLAFSIKWSVLALPAILFSHILALVAEFQGRLPYSFVEVTPPLAWVIIIAFVLLLIGGIFLKTRFVCIAYACFALMLGVGALPGESYSGCFEIGKGKGRVVAVSDGESSMVFCSGLQDYWYIKKLLAESHLPPHGVVIRLNVQLNEGNRKKMENEYFPLYSSAEEESIYQKGTRIALGRISFICESPPLYDRNRFGAYFFPSSWRVKVGSEEHRIGSK